MNATTTMAPSLGILLVALVTGCDHVDWPDPRYIDSLRVLGVRALPPTLVPGESTTLSLVCADGSRGLRDSPTCDAEVAWFSGCNNPEENKPEHCLNRYAKWSEALAARVADTPPPDFPSGFGLGPTFSLTPPDDVLSGTLELGHRSMRYGTSYVFFAACAGHLVTVRNAKDRLPVECRDRATGRTLDQRRFVVGVTAVYTYSGVVSRPPELLSPRFDGVALSTQCASRDDCQDGFECSEEGQCLPVVRACDSDHADRCENHCLTFELTLESFSFYENGARLDSPLKDLWLDYFTNAGELPDDDASFGLRPPANGSDPRPTRCIRWRAPPEPTEHAHVWAVARDNHGGLGAWDQRIIVR